MTPKKFRKVKKPRRKFKRKQIKPIGELYSPTSTFACDISLKRTKAKPPALEGDFVYMFDREGHKVIGRITSIDASAGDDGKMDADAAVEIFGHIGDEGRLRLKRFPLKPGIKAYKFQPKDLSKFLGLDKEDGIFVGRILDSEADIRLDLTKILRGHTAVMAKTGKGKSWFMGVFLEEVSKQNIPVCVMDPHGEYRSLETPFTTKKAIKELKKWGLKPKGFETYVIRVNPDLPEMGERFIKVTMEESRSGDIEADYSCRQLKFAASVTSDGRGHSVRREVHTTKELARLCKLFKKVVGRKPFVAVSKRSFKYKKEVVHPDFEYYQRWEHVELPYKPPPKRYAHKLRTHIKKLQTCQDIFRERHWEYFACIDTIPESDLIQKAKISIVDMHECDPETARVCVAECLERLFLQRKKGEVKPFICVVEEAHKFVPSRETCYSSDVLEMLSKEARKFGMPTMYVSQRPALISTTVRANCENWVILQTTHPSDQDAIINSCEGLDANSRGLIKNLPVGTAFFAGTLVEFPVMCNVRYRQSEHSYANGFVDMLKQFRGEELD